MRHIFLEKDRVEDLVSLMLTIEGTYSVDTITSSCTLIANYENAIKSTYEHAIKSTYEYAIKSTKEQYSPSELCEAIIKINDAFKQKFTMIHLAYDIFDANEFTSLADKDARKILNAKSVEELKGATHG